jgi:xylulokinase
MAYNSDPLILAIEISTAGCKVSIVSISGAIINSEFNKITLYYPVTGGIEINPEELWSTLILTISKTMERSHFDHSQIVAICCSSLCEGLIPVDSNGDALKNAVIWNDWQTDRDSYSIFKGWKSSAGIDLKKIQRWAKIHEGEAYPGAEEPAIQLLLFRDLYPDIFKQTHKFVNILDFINCKFTGRLVSTPDSDLTEWIKDSRNLVYEVFSQDLMRDRGFNEEKANEIVPNTAVIGEIKQDIAEQVHLPTGIKVVAGAMAVITSAFGSGAIEEFQPFYYLGSSSWFAVHLPEPPRRKKMGIQVNPSVVPGKYILASNQPAATANLNYLRDMVFFPGDELSGSVPPEDTFQIMDRMAAKTLPGSNGLVYFPWLKGVNGQKSGYYPHAVIFNLSTQHTRADIVRSVMEGVALNTRRLLDPIQNIIGRKFNRLNLAGGGGKSTIWCQIFADILNIPIRQVSDPGNANARGAALIAAVGLGYLSFEDASRVIQFQTVFSPREENRTLSDHMYKDFISIQRKVIDRYPTK